MHNEPTQPALALPKIDGVVISHQRCDHLDVRAIEHLASGGTHFFVPLGIGAHLERWQSAETAA